MGPLDPEDCPDGCVLEPRELLKGQEELSPGEEEPESLVRADTDHGRIMTEPSAYEHC